MLIKKGTILNINHNRKGKFLAIASVDIDTDNEWCHVKTLQNINGINSVNKWQEGEEVTLRKGLFSAEIIEVEDDKKE